VGKSGKYKAVVNHISAQIEYWAGGSSRCNFTFVGTKQQLNGSTPDYPVIPVRLQVGAQFDETMRVLLPENPKSASISMLRMAEDPSFSPDSIRITRNLKVANRDTFTMTAHIWADAFDPAANDITFDLASLHVVVPAGTIVFAANGKSFSAKMTLPGGGKFTLKGVPGTGKVTWTATGVDLSALNASDVLSLSMGYPEATWVGGLTFQVNKTGTIYKF
jgi:hypothetical protein